MVVCNDEGRQRCLVCDQRFEATSTPCQLYTHVVAKHEAILKRQDKCFPCLRDFDPRCLALGRGHTPKSLKAHFTGEESLCMNETKLVL